MHYSQRKSQVGSAIRQTTKKAICGALIQKTQQNFRHLWLIAFPYATPLLILNIKGNLNFRFSKRMYCLVFVHATHFKINVFKVLLVAFE